VVLDPEEQLRSLGSAAFPELRRVQAETIRLIRSGHSQTRDLAIELPTGRGKTLIALLLAHEVMTRGESAVYLAPTRQLSHQVAEEAARLGLPAEVMEAPLADISAARRRRVNRGAALGIFNYWAYFSEAEVVDPPALLLLDDAHLAEDAIADRYSIVIKRYAQAAAFNSILSVVADQAPGYSVADDIAAERPDASRQVPIAHVRGCCTDPAHRPASA
jgi:superfamily II DNA or RNA helicase